MKAVISVNPYDYLTMSFGNNWASCHTIDKTNLRDKGGNHNYEGCYSGGTVDLAEDESTVVMYLLPEDYNGEEPYTQDKIKRCLFYMGEDSYIQSRVYPDGRDGTDFTDIAEDMRKIMNNVLSECNNELSEWKTLSKEKNEFAIRNYAETVRGSLHYPDYFNYADIFLVKNSITENREIKKIMIGSSPKCLCCGRTNYNEKSIICYDCYDSDEDYTRCERCGERISYDESIYVEDNGCHYCCNSCAEDDGYHYCEDSDRYEPEDECYYDDYHGCWYTIDDRYRIETVDGSYYHGIDSAENAGYRETSDGDWYPEDEVHYCEHCDTYVHEDDWDDVHNCCTNCTDDVIEQESEVA